MAKETASIYIKIQNGDAERNIANLRKAYGEVNKEVNNAKVGSKEYIEALRKLREVDSQLRAHQQQVRKTGTAWSRVREIALGVFGGNLLMRGLQTFGAALQNATRIVMDFEKANSNLNAVLGVTSEETALLREQQKQLGASTAFTASQAADAQTELARLGFTIEEISNLTPAVLELAAASGTELANAAEIAGATLRGFGLDSSETQRVVDVMAKSFSASALSIDKFQVAMRVVAPIAAAAGQSIEYTTAQLGVLIDRGVRAETAGTGLRLILGRLAESGMSYADAMSMINNSTDATKTAIELFGIEASTMAVILAQNGTALTDLETKLNNAGGAAKAMADEQLNNLSGDLTILQSAWEGFILSIEDGEGSISSAARALVQLGTAIVNTFTQANSVSGKTGVSTFRLQLFQLYENIGLIDESLLTIDRRIQTFAASAKEALGKGNFQGARDDIQFLKDMAVEYSENENALKILTPLIKHLEGQMASGVIVVEGMNKVLNEETKARVGIITALKEQIKLIDERLESAGSQAQINALLDQRNAIEMQLNSILKQRELMRAIDQENKAVAPGLSETDSSEVFGWAAEAAAQMDAEQAILQKREDSIDAFYQEQLRLMQQDTDNFAESQRFKFELEQRVLNDRVFALAEFTSAVSGLFGESAKDSKVLASFSALLNAFGAINEVLNTKAPIDPITRGILATAIGVRAFANVKAINSTPVPAFARGTSYAPGGMALVGEQGPELVNLPRGSSVKTAAATDRFLKSGGLAGASFAGSTSTSIVPMAGLSNSAPDIEGAIMQMVQAVNNQRVEFVERDYQDFQQRRQESRKYLGFN